MSHQFTTATSFIGMQTGDIITMPMPLTIWQRFLIWIARPSRWPPKKAMKEFVISNVSDDTTVEVGFIRNSIEL